jgi:hypothetical protein
MKMLQDESREARKAWKDEGERAEQITFQPAELAALVRSRERLNNFTRWACVAVMTALAVGFLYNVTLEAQPWIRLGQAWAFGWLAYVFGTQVEFNKGRKGVDQSCFHFLELQHEERGRSYLRIRRRIWLLAPSILLSWVGGDPLAAAKARGLDPSSWLFHFCAGPWPFILVGATLVCVWLAFGRAAGKAKRDLNELRRSVSC